MDAGEARSRSRLPFAPWSLLLTLREAAARLGKMRPGPGKPIEAAYSRRPATVRAGAGAFCTRGVGFVCAHSRALPLGISQALGPARKGKGPVLLTRKAPAGCAGCQEINYYCLLPQRTCPDFKQPKSIVSSLALLRYCIAQHIKGAQSRTDARG